MSRRLSIPLIALLLVVAPVYWAWPEGLPPWRSTAIVSGWVGWGLLLASLLLMIRESWLAERLGGLERMYAWHHRLGLLAYLAQLPLDQLKIDQGFVRDLLSDPNDAAIVNTIIGLSQSLGLQVLAEGVETTAQRDMLLRAGCENFQGYLYGRPMPETDIDAVLLAPVPE